MKSPSRGYSLIEVLITAAIVSVGIAASAVMVRGIMEQEEASAAFLRGINLQEQAVRLWQMGLDEDDILPILPELIVDDTTPDAGAFFMDFGSPVTQTLSVTTSAGDLSMTVQVVTNTIVYSSLEVPPGETQGYISNSVTAVRPSIR
jgi:prepilin-type N-terminal cleavage/methylation domain-containing protein